MYSALMFLILAIICPLVLCDTDCDLQPFSLALTDVQVSPDVKESLMRGIPATIGSSGQKIVMLPWPELNNTVIYDQQSFCDKTVIWNDEICEVRRGNLLDQSDSDTFDKAKDVPGAGGALEEAEFEGSEKGIAEIVSTSLGATDELTLDGSDAIEEFPFAVPRQQWDYGYTFLHSLGMGRDSTYLNTLKDTGKISARVWSIFWGRMWTKEPIDGSVVVGGYDQAKVIGDNYTDVLDYTDRRGSGCWTGMKVVVRDIQLNFRDGSDKSIFPVNSAVPFCIVPQRQLLFEAPGALLDTFEELTMTKNIGASEGLHWSAKLFSNASYFDGDMTFFLDSGLEVRIPNDQFMTPFVDIDRQGKRVVNEGKREFLMHALADQPATLGRYFLTAAYLMVNHDSNSFTLWQANPTTSEDLVPVYDEEAAQKCKGDVSGPVQPSVSPIATTTNTPGNDAKNDEGQDNEDSNEESISPAIIGGAAGGGGAVLVIIGVAVFFLIRRRRQRRDAAAEIAARAETHPPHYDYKDRQPYYYPPQWGVQEVAGSEPARHEVAGSDGPRYFELDGGDYVRRV